MKKHKIYKFTYTKDNGDISQREVYVAGVPNKNYFTIDLSEYNEEEKEIYIKGIKEIYETYTEGLKEEIKALGLGSNYRFFKEDGISNVEEVDQ